MAHRECLLRANLVTEDLPQSKYSCPHHRLVTIPITFFRSFLNGKERQACQYLRQIRSQERIAYTQHAYHRIANLN